MGAIDIPFIIIISRLAGSIYCVRVSDIQYSMHNTEAKCVFGIETLPFYSSCYLFFILFYSRPLTGGELQERAQAARQRYAENIAHVACEQTGNTTEGTL